MASTSYAFTTEPDRPPVTGPDIKRLYQSREFASRPIEEQLQELERMKEDAADEPTRQLIERIQAPLRAV